MGSPGEKRRVFPALEAIPDVTQGERHLMADALLSAEEGRKVPVDLVLRAVGILKRLNNMAGRA